MNLSTIWTISAMTLRERISRTKEWAWQKAAHRLPRRLAYWSFIDSGVRYMDKNAVVPEVPFCDILDNFDTEVRA